ncbi:ABC transporter ATP-binding protein [Candidatus Parcubacteria bacterium]|nr:ABC transporter ATP-binding protein [Candidatus Parcubacteria bacterium]
MEIIQEFKIIWEYLRKYKKAVKKTAILAMVGATITAIIPYIYGRLVDAVSIEVFSLDFVLALLGIWVLMSLCSAILKRIVSVSASFTSINISNDLICESSEHIINLPLSFHKEKKVGEILSRITRACERLREIIGYMTFWILPQFFTVLVGVTILFFVDWRLSLGALTIFLPSIIITIYRTPSILEASKKLNEKFDQGLGIINDSFLNVQSIKSCAAEWFQKEKIDSSYKKEVASAFKKLIILWHNTTLCQQIILSLGFLIIFGYAIFLLKINQITSGELIMFLGYLNLVQAPLSDLLYQWISFQQGMTVIKRARKLLFIKPEHYNLEGKILKEVQGKVEFKNVSFGYKEKNLILTDINLTAPAGKKIAIVGGSGEGKTTLVDLISLYFIPTRGKILIDSIDIKKLNLSFLRKTIAYVPQEIILFNDTIKSNIQYGKPNASEQEIIEAAKAANAHNFIEAFPKKYEQLVGERGIKLSTGQKQRLAIARALIRNPKILILDEATSSLDMESERLVQGALEKLIKNRTTFIIAHRLSTVRNADKILVLEKGKIVEQGTHKELIKKKGRYFKFYSLQFKI